MGLLNSGFRGCCIATLLVCCSVLVGCTDAQPRSESPNAMSTSKDEPKSDGDVKTEVAKLDLAEPAEVVDDPAELAIGDPAPMIFPNGSKVSRWPLTLRARSLSLSFGRHGAGLVSGACLTLLHFSPNTVRR